VHQAFDTAELRKAGSDQLAIIAQLGLLPEPEPESVAR
jgi:hypothetical protein